MRRSVTPIRGTAVNRKQNKSCKILIVDDGRDFRQAFREFLTLFGYRVQEAPDGRKALCLLQKTHDIDLVLLDVSMPGLDGMEVLSKIKKTAPALDVIFLTGYSAQDIAASVPEGHVQGCIEKTANPDKIRDLIEKVLKNKKISQKPCRLRAGKDGTSNGWLSEYCSR